MPWSNAARTMARPSGELISSLRLRHAAELGQPSHQLRTLVLQELLGRVLAPSFVVSAADDQAAIAHTVNAVAEATPAYLHGVGPVLRGRSVRPALRSRG